LKTGGWPGAAKGSALSFGNAGGGCGIFGKLNLGRGI